VCTVSWLHLDDVYHLLCNRDEKLTRPSALGPEIQRRDGVRFVAPVDRLAGGSWIGTNEFGMSVCLLNAPQMTEHLSGQHYHSRGLILQELLSAASVDEASARLWQFDLSLFAPFTIALLKSGRHSTVIDWDGREKAVIPFADPCMPLVSSSIDPQGVKLRRRDQFHRHVRAAGKLDAAVLFTFHLSHGVAADAYSPCMHRSDAETVSFSWVKVTETQVEFFYAPGPPCRWAPGETRTLPRVL